MAKGLSLEEFKSQLDTDAQRRVRAQEETIKSLHAEIKDLREQRDKEAYFLFNRCMVQSKGFLCIFCGLKSRCVEVRGNKNE